MVFICIYLGLIQSLKLKGGNFDLQVTLNNSRASAMPRVPILGFHRQTKKRASRSNNQQVKKQRFKKMNLVSIGNS
jgi:hypothetical protein